MSKKKSRKNILNIRCLMCFLILFIVVACASENKEWERAKLSNTLFSYKHFLSKYPESQFKDIAIDAIDSINIKTVDSINTWQAYQQFVDSFPNSKYLEYARNKVAQEWWSVKILNATLKESEQIGENMNAITVTPQTGNSIGKIELEITALKGEKGNLRNRLLKHETLLNPFIIDYLSGVKPEALKKNVIGLMHNPADVSSIETQLFISKFIYLSIDSLHNTPIYAQFHSSYGLTMTNNNFSTIIEDYNSLIHNAVFFLRPDFFAAWFQPERKVLLTLYFSIPKGTESTDLTFYNLPSLKINFDKK